MRPALEVADIFRRHGAAYRADHAGSLIHGQRRVMAAIEACRTAALGGHVERCDDCGEIRIAYNSCRNRHCPKCQGLARAQWLAERQAELLPVPYFHVVFTMPAPIAGIALQNKAVVYDILFQAAAETLRTIAADPKHLGAEIGMIAVLHTWGQNLFHHPHIHCIVPGGGLSPDGRWIACRPGFFLSGPGALPPLPPAVPGTAAGGLRCRDAELLRRAGRARQAGGLRRPSATLAPGSNGSSTPSVPSAARSRCSTISAATPIEWPSPTVGSSHLAERQVRFRWKDYRHPQQAQDDDA